MNPKFTKIFALSKSKLRFGIGLIGVLSLLALSLYKLQLFLFENESEKELEKHQIVVTLPSVLPLLNESKPISKILSLPSQLKEETSENIITTLEGSSHPNKTKPSTDVADTNSKKQINDVLPPPILGKNFPKDGAFFTYRQAFSNPQKMPRITILITHMGMNTDQITDLIRNLPSPITLAFAPAASNLAAQIQESYQQGHDTLMMMPLEPVYYPENNPGENLLLTGLSPNENIRRIQIHLKESRGIIGVVGLMGSRFLASPLDVTVLLKELQKRGLMMIEAPTCLRSVTETLAFGVGVPFLSFGTQIDETLDQDRIEAQLKILEENALKTGSARGYGAAYPVTLRTLIQWAETLSQKGIILAPVSAEGPLSETGVTP